MIAKEKYPAESAITFVWIGFVSAISFMAAPLRTQVQGITVATAAAIGHLISSYMNRAEWLFAIIIIIGLILKKEGKKYLLLLLFLLPLGILTFQTAWLIPGLDNSAETLIKGVHVPPSDFDSWYLRSEVIKVISLFSFGVTLLK